ncbi:hypothetical protein OUZ56_000922 [Daphnia magna]|uniref:Uncharacterized protein n=1 Tax=Daphnia magna TaxID=35525 RepID=A0ABR0A154_9CRUS|nr:hypothetical protein OUZ56_000922 [Daphnia magna]
MSRLAPLMLSPVETGETHSFYWPIAKPRTSTTKQFSLYTQIKLGVSRFHCARQSFDCDGSFRPTD